jgi:hypothetical protein
MRRNKTQIKKSGMQMDISKISKSGQQQTQRKSRESSEIILRSYIPINGKS